MATARLPEQSAAPTGPQVAINKGARRAYRRETPDGEWVAVEFGAMPTMAKAASVGHVKIGNNWYAVYPAKVG